MIGGQILRTSLALSLVAGQPFRMEGIRTKRQKPGLLRQHLMAVDAAKTVGCAEVESAELNSQTLEFQLGPVTPGNYRYAVGTAGRATLVCSGRSRARSSERGEGLAECQCAGDEYLADQLLLKSAF